MAGKLQALAREHPALAALKLGRKGSVGAVYTHRPEPLRASNRARLAGQQAATRDAEPGV